MSYVPPHRRSNSSQPQPQPWPQPQLQPRQPQYRRSAGVVPWTKLGDGEWYLLAQVSYSSSLYDGLKLDPFRGQLATHEPPGSNGFLECAARRTWVESVAALSLSPALLDQWPQIEGLTHVRVCFENAEDLRDFVHASDRNRALLSVPQDGVNDLCDRLDRLEVESGYCPPLPTVEQLEFLGGLAWIRYSSVNEQPEYRVSTHLNRCLGAVDPNFLLEHLEEQQPVLLHRTASQYRGGEIHTFTHSEACSPTAELMPPEDASWRYSPGMKQLVDEGRDSECYKRWVCAKRLAQITVYPEDREEMMRKLEATDPEGFERLRSLEMGGAAGEQEQQNPVEEDVDPLEAGDSVLEPVGERACGEWDDFTRLLEG